MNDGDPTIEMWLRRVAGGVCCVVGITWPNGHYSEWSETLALPAEVGGDDNYENVPGVDVPLRRSNHTTSTGWTFGEKRITTADAKALQNYAAKNATWLGKYGNHDKPDHVAQQRVDDHRTKIIADQYFAARILDTLTKHERTWIRDHYNPKNDIFHKIERAASSAAHTVEKISENPFVDAALPVFAINVNPHLTPIRDEVVKNLPGGSAALKATNAAKAITTGKELVAKAQGLKKSLDSLKSTPTVKALTSAGVPQDAVKRATSILEGVRTATAALALEAQGHTAAAEPYKRAAAAHAQAAKKPAAAVHQAAQKVYYLALTEAAS